MIYISLLILAVFTCLVAKDRDLIISMCGVGALILTGIIFMDCMG